MDVPPIVEWAIGQGVAVAVLAFVLIRLETSMAQLQRTLDSLKLVVDVLCREAEHRAK